MINFAFQDNQIDMGKTKNKKNMSSKSLWVKRIVIAMWSVFVLGIVISALVFFLIAKGKIGYMPPVQELENPIDKYASQIIASDGVTLGSYGQSSENRIFVTYKDLSPYLVEALIATEDIRFADHSGIDLQGLMRAVVKRGLLHQKSGGGGSTITQQLAKQLYSPSVDNVIDRLLQKPIEWVIAVKLERFYTKEEIINMYLNKFDFLYNAIGIRSASQVYFDKLPSELNVEEAATLVGMCKNPSYFNPLRYNERTMGRRNVVLKQMEKAGYLTSNQLDSLKQLPLTLKFSKMDHKDGLAPYFREYLRSILTAKKPNKSHYRGWQKQKFYDDSLAWEKNPLYGWCEKNFKADGSKYNIYTDGLKIYTTINSHMQKYAEEAVYEHIGTYLQKRFFAEKKGRSYAPYSNKLSKEDIEKMINRSVKQSDRYRMLKKEGASDAEIMKVFKKPVEMNVFSWKGEVDTLMSPLDSIRYHKSFLRTGFMAMNPRNGHVKAYVGGINYRYFQYDMVNGGRRQVGSTIKPFLYSLAMIEGFSPCDEMLHVPQVLVDENGKEWKPNNEGAKREGEMVTIQWGLQTSSNWVTAYLMKHLSPYTFVRLLHSFGLQSDIDPVLSSSLGTPEASVSEMVSGYSTFANNGIRVEPLYVTRIEDQYGNVISEFPSQMVEVLPQDASYKMLYMLQSVVDAGTGRRLRFRYNLKGPYGGKTGTSQEHADGWFMAFSPQLVGGCWVGGEEPSIHFDSMADGQGANMALPVFGLFMQKVLKDKTLNYTEDSEFIVTSTLKDPCGDEEPKREDPQTSSGIDDIFK